MVKLSPSHPGPHLIGGVILAMLAGCEPTTPCQRYVDYMCDCHDPTVSCADLEATYLGADSDIQSECALLLDEQQSIDESDGVDCGI